MQSDTIGLLHKLSCDWFLISQAGPSNVRLNAVEEVHYGLLVDELGVDVLWHDYTSHMGGLNECSGGRVDRPFRLPSSVSDLL